MEPRKHTVLVVDDATENIKVLSQALRGEYEILFAMSGEDALETLTANPDVDLILLDIEMQGLDGYEVCRRLKADSRTELIPIIFITAKEDEEDEMKGLELGAVDYIKKPFSIPVVKARVRRHLGTSRTGGPLRQDAKRIGGYDIVRRLSSGGMGNVFLAKRSGQHGFMKKVAIKLVHAHLAEHESYKELFFHEARIAAQLSHPCICQVFDFGEERGLYYIVMEYVNGTSLARLLKMLHKTKERVPPPIVAHLVAEAARGLHHAHTAKSANGLPLNIVHRDVSPQNVMVTAQGSVKLLDFGIARSVDRESLTETGTVRGKPAYMAPEQAKGETVDHRADIFSLGIVMYELLTGARLFSREHQYATYGALLDDPVPDIRLKMPDLPEPIAAVVHRALSRDPAERYPTAAAMAEALDAAVSGERVNRDVVVAYLTELGVDVWGMAEAPDAETAIDETQATLGTESIKSPKSVSGEGEG